MEAPIGLPIINERHVYDLQGTACTFTVDTGSDCVVIGEDENSLIKGIIQINSIPKLILELQRSMDIVDESKERHRTQKDAGLTYTATENVANKKYQT